MIKFILVAFVSAMVFTSKDGCGCQGTTSKTGCYKGRLEIKGMCSNYTIKVLEGNIDPTLIEAKWTDEQTNKSYTNVFGLGSPCTFPNDLKEGDTFYFQIDSTTVQNCNVCMAYYPTPPKKLRIKVFKNPCP
jgi:hypothetical protein